MVLAGIAPTEVHQRWEFLYQVPNNINEMVNALVIVTRSAVNSRFLHPYIQVRDSSLHRRVVNNFLQDPSWQFSSPLVLIFNTIGTEVSTEDKVLRMGPASW